MELGPFQLTYCTNIHAGTGWEEVLANLSYHAPRLKQRLAPDSPFGLGLRLSAGECEELLGAARLEAFKDFMAKHGLYVCLLNGFVHGSFHKRVVKQGVFEPDWRAQPRVDYTLRLLEVLRALLPEGFEGGISTSPLSYRKWVSPDDGEAREAMARKVALVAQAMARLRQEEGKLVHLDIEPEPDGLIENSRQLVSFFEDQLLRTGAEQLAASLRLPLGRARGLILEHVRVCYDTCHFAVAYEEPEEALQRLTKAGIAVGRVQVSSAVDVELPDDPVRRAGILAQLEPFAESVYLHQVCEQERDGELRTYADLGDALGARGRPGARRWRIHFHVPLFVSEYGALSSTQPYIRQVFGLLRSRAFTRHLEIETYTWDVLPAALKQDLVESICREYRWVLDELQVAAAQSQPA